MTRRRKPDAGAALDDIAAALDNPAAAPTAAMAGDRAAGQLMDDDGSEPFPLDCPVIPLGIQSSIDGSQRCYYLNVNGEIVSLEAGNKHGKNNLIHLFGRRARYLELTWTRWSTPKRERVNGKWEEVEPAQPIGFDQAQASQALIMECARRGIFDPAGRLRGRGAHPIKGGGLALHMGDAIGAVIPRVSGDMAPLSYHDTGLYERFVYPAAPPLPRPWAQSVPPTAAIALADVLRTWNWVRPDLDPVLVLGAIGQGFIGGALAWRSNVWITGPRGTGKSALNGKHGILPKLYGDMLFRTGNTSAAAIRQSLKNSTVPVMIDELEPGADNRKVTEVIELARVASSGDQIHRGGQDHQAHEFTLQSPFWFSSINIPPLEASDLSRLAILNLKPFAPGTKAPDFSRIDFADMGRKLFRRMVDGWAFFGKTRAILHDLLVARGHDGRGADQFSTLLACAWVLMNDDAPHEEDVFEWVQWCRPLRMAEVADAISDEEACINHLMTALIQARGKDSREAVSEMIGRAVHTADNPATPESESKTYIEQIGLKVMNAVWWPAEGDKPGRWGAQRFTPASAPGFLAVAAKHQELDRIFANTKWQRGVWKQTLARVPGAIDVAAVSFARLKIRAVLVPLYAVLDEMELPERSHENATLAWIAQQKGAEE